MAALPSLPVRGRDAQLAVLDERLKQARDGIGSVVVIEGGPGLGEDTVASGGVDQRASAWRFARARGMADPIDERCRAGAADGSVVRF